MIAPPPLAGFFHPPTFDPAAIFQSIEQRVERGGVEFQHAVRSLLDQFADFVAVAWADLQERENEQFGAALLQLAVGFLIIDSLHKHILRSRLLCVKGNSPDMRLSAGKDRLGRWAIAAMRSGMQHWEMTNHFASRWRHPGRCGATPV